MADMLLKDIGSFGLRPVGCRPFKRRRKGSDPSKVQPCRVTNTEEEMRDPADPHQQYVDMGPQHQEFKPELGPLSRRVETTFLEGIYSEKVNFEETDYWFTEPEGFSSQTIQAILPIETRRGVIVLPEAQTPPCGWNSENLIALRGQKVDTEENSSINYGPGRTELHDLKEGAVMAGVVNTLMYNHGVQVDLGAQHDGLIPVRGEQWVEDHFRSKYGVTLGVSEDFYIGQAVKVRIHKINHRPRCRFPIQLEVLFPDVQHKLSHPDDYTFCFDLRGVRSREEAYAITGRPREEDETLQDGYIDHNEIKDLELAQRVPEFSATSYGEKEIDFEGIDIWDQEVMDMLDSRDFGSSADGDPQDTTEVIQEEDMYVESS